MQNLHLPGADVRFRPDFLEARDADRLASALYAGLPWEQGCITIQGRRIPEPRLTSWHGDGASYSYSNRTLYPHAWTEELLEIRVKIEDLTGARFNSVLANLYRAGHRDSIGMHSDSEPELGRHPTLASVSLGHERTFIMVPKPGRAGQRTEIPLPHGSLLMMAKDTQDNWKHGIEKERTVSPAWRINLTFRNIISR